MAAQQQQELIDFLRNNLQVEVSCEDLAVQVTVSLCGEEISTSRDWLPSLSSFECGDMW